MSIILLSVFFNVFSLMINTNIITKEKVCEQVKKKITDPYEIAANIVTGFAALSNPEQTSYAEAVDSFILKCKEPSFYIGPQQITLTSSSTVVSEVPDGTDLVDYLIYSDFSVDTNDEVNKEQLSTNQVKNICNYLKNKNPFDIKNVNNRHNQFFFTDFLEAKIDGKRGEFFMDLWGKNLLVFFAYNVISDYEKNSSTNPSFEKIGKDIGKKLMAKYRYSYSSGNFLKARLITKNYKSILGWSIEDDFFDNDKIIEIIRRVLIINEILKYIEAKRLEISNINPKAKDAKNNIENINESITSECIKKIDLNSYKTESSNIFKGIKKADQNE